MLRREYRHRIRTAAVRVIGELRDGKRELAAPPDQARLQQMLSFSLAEEVSEGYAAMLMEETRFRDRDDQWRSSLSVALENPDNQDFHVTIIGAGMSGLGTAAKLKAAGIDFTILEKNAEVGGTWFENRYPDCGVDTPNHYYSYSFNRNNQLVWILFQAR